MEEQLEQIEVHQQLLSKREAGGRMGESSGGQGHHTPGGGRTSQSQVDGWNSLTKNVNAVHLRKVTLSCGFFLKSKKTLDSTGLNQQQRS